MMAAEMPAAPQKRLLDHPDNIRAADKKSRRQGASSRLMTVFIMKEYASRLCALRRLGKVGEEDYLCTAFMAAVTMLHE